jgi:tRNA dimethylallyltransferase
MTGLLAVVGPTGTGKSNLAIALAHELKAQGQKAEIINSDSMQFYRGMNIGTAKLSDQEREGVKHHLIDILEITDESTAAEYQRIARPLIEDIQARGAVPILCGGSMLYVAAVLNTFEFPGHDDELRAELEADLEARGSVALHADLAKLDPSAATRVDPLNPRRVVRALEIVRLTGQPFAAALPDKPESWQPVLEIGLNSERQHLVERLHRRVDKMWADGLLNEVEQLIPAGIRHGKTASRAIGYAQALAQLDGTMSQDDAIALTAQLTSRYARRQMSWFRRDDRINWLDYQAPDLLSDARALVFEYLAKF